MPKIIADGTEFEVPTFNLGEFRLLKREFNVESPHDLNPSDPDHLVGMLFVIARRKDPNVRVEAIEAVTEVEFVGDEEAKADPLAHSASSSEAAPTAAPGDGGGSGTTPASSGGHDS